MSKVKRFILIIITVLFGLILVIQLIGDDLQSRDVLIFAILLIGCIITKKENQVSTNISSNNYTNRIDKNNQNIDYDNPKLIMVINDIYTLLGEGTVVLGTVLKDTLHTYEHVIIKTKDGNNLESQITNFRQNIDGVNRKIDFAIKGDYITIHLIGIYKNQISIGDSIYSKW